MEMNFFDPKKLMPEALTQCLILYSNGEIHEGIYIGNGTFRVPDWVVVPADVKVIGWQHMVTGSLEVPEDEA